MSQIMEMQQPQADGFSNAFIADELNWDHLGLTVAAITGDEVERVLSKPQKNWRDFIALVSPAAEQYLESMAQLSQRLTRKRFGNTINLYVPLYLSNLCSNECTYCGFSITNAIKRKKLDLQEIDQEIAAIKKMGFDSILLVTGESDRLAGVDYLAQVVAHIRPQISYLAIEVQPLGQSEYLQLKQLGVDAVMVYQETYHQPTYAQCHLRGKKQDFFYRLDTADRAAAIDMDKIGLGALLGLSGNWQVDSILTAAHLDYLQRKYWKTRYSISFPRLRPCAGGQQPLSELTDRQLLQLICAWRICFPEVELSLSTRESSWFRDHVFALGITHASAASQTQPGGYADPQQQHLEQFSIDDNRPADAVAAAIIKAGLDPVWTDWHRAYSG